MNSKPTANLGTPVEVDIAVIEKELRSFWKSADQMGPGAVMRACSCNLVSFLRNRNTAEEYLPILSTVSEWHPSRSILAYVEPDDVLNPPDMHAWISAQCSIPLSGGPQVCCEAITIAARNRARMNVPYTVTSLLVPDLPVYLYWRSFRITDRDLIERMARFSRLLIVDSHQSRQDPQNRLQILQLLLDQPAGISMRDLNWARITAWRDLIAQFFDAPCSVGYVREVSEVEITRHLSAPNSIPTRTLLLTGWMTSSLGWKLLSAKRTGDTWESRWRRENGEVRVSFTGKELRPGQVPGINSVTMRSGDGAEFSVFVEAGSRYLSAVASIEGNRIIHSVPEDALDEASLLIRELSYTGEDVVFKKALAEAYELEKAFRSHG
jgi:glucose-6-phosphate dehydrogenase assembly protein OpcA